MHNVFDNLDRETGNGARSKQEEWLDENTTAAKHEWSSAETTFYYWEAPQSRRDEFYEFYQQHHGKNDSNRSAELPRMRALSDARAFSSMLELPEIVRERIIFIVEDIELAATTFGGKSYEKIVLGVISLSHDEYLSSLPRDAVSYDERLIFDETFNELMRVNNLSSSELRGVREQIRSKSQYF